VGLTRPGGKGGLGVEYLRTMLERKGKREERGKADDLCWRMCGGRWVAEERRLCEEKER